MELPLNSFITRQINRISEEGWPTIRRKLKIVSWRFIRFLLTLLAIPLVIIIRLIKPLYWLRFGWIFGSKIGHLVFDVEYYLTEKKLGLHPAKTIDIFFYRWGKPPNIFFKKLTERYLFIQSWVEPLFIANDWLPGGDQYKIMPAISSSQARDRKGLFGKVEVQLAFTDEENQIGQSFLDSVGACGQKYVCLMVRDSSYYNSKIFDYHNYRDSDIDTYNEAALALARRGYWVFRMGKIVAKPFSAKHSRILDYANTSHRSDFLDIWLMANCFFCISTGTGLDEVARIFRKKIVCVNYIYVLGMLTDIECITTFKHLFFQGKNSYLTLSEELDHAYNFSQEYENAKIQIRDSSTVEILQVVLEMEARLNGKWEDAEEDQYFQDRFWSIFKSHPEFKKYHEIIHPEVRVGTHFLRNNPEWLN